MIFTNLMPSSTNEDYLKEIYKQSAVAPDGLARTAPIAAALSVTPGSATVMLQSLKREGYLEYAPHRGCRLTEKGQKVALDLIRKHRLIELFLKRFLELDWGDVHEEAEVMEHCFSQKVIARLDALLGFPRTDPHGEIIPGRDLKAIQNEDQPLAEAPFPGRYEISRITRQDGAFLKQCTALGLLPKKRVRLILRNEALGVLEFGIGAAKGTLSLEAAGFIYVRALA